MCTVIDNVFDDFDLVREVFNSSLFGMSDCFGNLQDGVADIVFPFGDFISKTLDRDIVIFGGCFYLGGRAIPKYESSLCLIALADGFVNGIEVTENQCLLFSNFEKLVTNVPSIIVFYNAPTPTHRD